MVLSVMTHLIGCDPDLLQPRKMPPDTAAQINLAVSQSEKNRFGVSPVPVTYIIDHLHNIRAGGEQALLRIIRHLPRDRFQPSVVTFNVKPSSVQILRELECPLHVFPIQRTYDWAGFATALRLRSLLAVKGPSIVHTFFETSNIWGGLITKLSFGPMLVSSRRDMGVLRATKHRFAYKLINVLSDRVLAVSNEVRRLCIEREGIRAGKVSTVYNGVDLSCVDRAEDRFPLKEKLRIRGGSPVVTTVANIRRIKGLDVFIKAAAIVHSRFRFAVFVVAGWPNEPKYFDELQQLVAALGLQNNFYFLGEVEDVFPLLKQSDVFCLLSRSEGFSNALLEAMACRLPCVATRVGGNAEAIDDGSNGYLVSAEDPKAAAERVTMLLESRERAREIGEAARRTIEARFTVQTMIDQLTDLYDGLLAVDAHATH
jgi:L-malate glycosyltransferase